MYGSVVGLPAESGNPSAGGKAKNGRSGTEPAHGDGNQTATPKNPRCPCGETDPERFARKTQRGKVGYQHRCKACMVEIHRQWRATADGRAKMRAGVTASKRRYPEKERCRRVFRAALLRGELTPGPCYAAEHNECEGKVEAHHHDYSKPLAVIYTCRRHHRALDIARRATEAA